ncbi:MAG: hypothetical protein J7K75_03685 [Desulfuromonas sp.]|nr:hypothetical protein [Desulfuromonas sp.]
MQKTSSNAAERLQISPEVAQILSPQTSAAQKMKAARGTLPMSEVDRVYAQFLLYAQGDAALKTAILDTLRQSSNNALRPILKSADHHPRLLDFLARARINELGTLILLRNNPAVDNATWIHVFSHCNYEILSYFCDATFSRTFPPQVCAAVLNNPQASDEMIQQIRQPVVDFADTENAQSDREEELDEELIDFSADFEETQNISKQKIVLELDISEKIKMAMTGDKEWRTILVKDSNKLVSGAVLKNPRITEGEVLFLTQNRSTSDEIIRIVLLNREWLKSYAIRHALVCHPRTPLAKAMRFLSTMNEKDVRTLAKSRNVPSAIVNSCRRMVAAKQRH